MKTFALFKIGYMPRWCIVWMDLLLSFFSIVLSYLLRFNFETQRINNDLFIRGIFITVAVYLAFFLIFRSFKEIVRHTTFNGVLKILMAVFSANIFLVFVNLIFSKNEYFVPNSVIAINFFISFFMLAVTRIAIKEIFQIASSAKKQSVLLFGAGAIGQAALQTIVADKFSSWRVIGFVDDDPAKLYKNLGGVPVYDIKQISKVLNKNNVSRVIIAVNNISVERRNAVAEFFIEKGMQVSVLPHNHKWLDDPFKVRRLRDIKIEDLLQRMPIQINNAAINSTLKNKCILITGAAGSIGSEIVKQAIAFKPAMLLLCDIAESPLHDMGLYMYENASGINYKLIIGSIKDAGYMEKIFSIYKPHIVFHAAAL